MKKNDVIKGTLTAVGNDISSVEYLKDYVKNGIAYVTGGGDDTVTGTQYDDIMLGGLGNDTLNGGDGDDIIYGNDKIPSFEQFIAKHFNLDTETDDDVLNGGKEMIDYSETREMTPLTVAKAKIPSKAEKVTIR